MNNQQSGLAMVIVIWVLTLLTIMAGSFALTMRRETTLVSAVKDNAMALAMAETGIAIAQKMLMMKDKSKRWRVDGALYKLRYRDAEIRVRVMSENGKIDINKAGEALLSKMMSSTDVSLEKQQQLVSAILDWRDKDDLIHHNGAEKQQYEEEGLSYKPTNKNFQTSDELQMVLGMDAKIFIQLQPLITVYSTLKQVDLQVAGKEVIAVIGNQDLIETEEDMHAQIEEVQVDLAGVDIESSLNNKGKYDGAGNQTYTVISEARLEGDMSGGIKVIIKKKSPKNSANFFEILDWQQNYQQLSLFSNDLK